MTTCNIIYFFFSQRTSNFVMCVSICCKSFVIISTVNFSSMLCLKRERINEVYDSQMNFWFILFVENETTTTLNNFHSHLRMLCIFYSNELASSIWTLIIFFNCRFVFQFEILNLDINRNFDVFGWVFVFVKTM